MTAFLARARVATVVAAALALLVAGVAAGAAGAALIIGQANDGGSSQTVLTNAGLGASFTLKTTNVSTNASGIFGWSSSTAANATRGVYGRADGENSYGVYAVNTSAIEGGGAAIYANGQQNEGVYATSDDTNALTGVVTTCDGVFLCGGNGVAGTGYGFAAGVFGDGTEAVAGVWASEGAAAAVYATQAAADVPAVYADSTNGTAVQGYGEGGVSPSVTTSAGGSFSGLNGVYGQTDVGFGVGVYGRSNGGFNFAIYADGNSYVNGDFSVSGTCTGCAAALMAVNGSGATLTQGDAVALEGVQQTADGTIVLVVRAARKNDAVIGIVDRQMTQAPASIKTTTVERTVKVNRGSERVVRAAARTMPALKGVWQNGATSVANGKYLRIITGGLFAFTAAAPTGAAVGDTLAVGDSAGKLGKAPSGSSAAGRYLGKLTDGRIVIFVQAN